MNIARAGGWTILAIGLAAVIVGGLAVGAVPIDFPTLWHALTGQGDDLASAIVREARLPRVLVGLLVGASLGTAGAIMQALTRNPLAGPGLMGLNGGATALLVLTVIWAPGLGLDRLMAVAMIGAGLGALLVWSLAAAIPLGFAPQRLALIGACVSGLLVSATAAAAVATGMQNDLLYWMVGGLGTVGWRELFQLLPVCTIGLAIAWLLAPALAVASLGDEAAAGLGLRVKRTRLLGSLAVLALAGSANAIAGPVGFVGLMGPHIARMLVGADDRRVIPAAGLVGAMLVTAADALGRWVAPPAEQPLGVFMALIGGPFLIVLARGRSSEGRP